MHSIRKLQIIINPHSETLASLSICDNVIRGVCLRISCKTFLVLIRTAVAEFTVTSSILGGSRNMSASSLGVFMDVLWHPRHRINSSEEL